MREISSSELYRMMYNLPRGKCFTVDMHDISRAILVLLNFTGIDLMGCTRSEDVDRFIKTYSKNFKLDIVHDEFNGRMTFRHTEKPDVHCHKGCGMTSVEEHCSKCDEGCFLPKKEKMPVPHEHLNLSKRGVVDAK